MDSHLSGRRLAAVAGLSAVIAMGAMTAACAKEEKTPPTTTTTTTTSTTTPTSGTGAPGEKSINPTGGNLFTPPVVATPAPNVPPGQHPGLNGAP
jgi:hypothetical protein